MSEELAYSNYSTRDGAFSVQDILDLNEKMIADLGYKPAFNVILMTVDCFERLKTKFGTPTVRTSRVMDLTGIPVETFATEEELEKRFAELVYDGKLPYAVSMGKRMESD